MKKLTEQDLMDIHAALLEGQAINEIAHSVGHSKSVVKRVACLLDGDRFVQRETRQKPEEQQA